MPSIKQQSDMVWKANQRVDLEDLNNIKTCYNNLIKELTAFVLQSGTSERVSDYNGRVMYGFTGSAGSGLTFAFDAAEGIALAPDGSLLELLSTSPLSNLSLTANKTSYIHFYQTTTPSHPDDRRFRGSTTPYAEYTVSGNTTRETKTVAVHVLERAVEVPSLEHFQYAATIGGIPRYLVAGYAVTTDGTGITGVVDFRRMILPNGNRAANAVDELSDVPTDMTKIRSVSDVLLLIAKSLRDVKGTPEWWDSPAATLATLAAFASSAHTWTAKQTFNVAGGDAAPVCDMPVAVTNRKLLWEFSSSSGSSRKARFYLNSSGELEITENAFWRTSDSQWQADVSTVLSRADSMRVVIRPSHTAFGGGGLSVYRPNSTVTSNSWSNIAWEGVVIDGGSITFTGAEAETHGTNPPNTTAVQNSVCAKNTCKSWGTLRLVSGVVSVIDGFNVTAVRNSTFIEVTMPQAMATTSYCVVPTFGDCNDLSVTRIVFDRATISGSTFRLIFRDAAGEPVSAAGLTTHVDFVVYGVQ